MGLVDLAYGAALVAYLGTLAYVTVYCLLQLRLLVAYLRRERNPLPRERPAAVLPRVTVQLPIYNERYVAERIVDAACGLRYPRERLQIQVLDDSTDDTTVLLAERVRRWRRSGVDVVHVRRDSRRGYKAGALRDAMATATGEFVAIFDADFVPAPEFLLTSVPHFADPSVGVVQSRWEHLNEDYSLITRLQALQLNVHFTVEQAGRRAAGLFAQFNGTAGVWRTACIEDAGGWRALTLTEDLDLSIRAQLRGWRIHYLHDNLAPAELPAEMVAFKGQQHRWMKGGAECARELLGAVWRAESLSFAEKLYTTSHLLASSIFVFVCLIGLLSVPAMFGVVHFGLDPIWFSGFLTATVAVGAVYFVANVQASWRDVPMWRGVLRFAGLFPAFLSLSMGLSLHNGAAVIEGFRGRRSAFVRTPKFAIGSGHEVATNAYRSRELHWTTYGEGALALMFAAAVAWALATGHTSFALFHLMLAVGYGAICAFTLRDSFLPKAVPIPSPARPRRVCEPRMFVEQAAAPSVVGERV